MAFVLLAVGLVPRAVAVAVVLVEAEAAGLMVRMDSDLGDGRLLGLSESVVRKRSRLSVRSFLYFVSVALLLPSL